MTVQQITYLLSISFQLSGALILIFFCWGDTKHLVLNKVFPANSVIERNDDNKVVISRDKLFRAYKEIWLNRIAFILLGLGYLLSVSGSSKGLILWSSCLLVILGGVIMMMVGNKIAAVVAGIKSNHVIEFDSEELCSIIDADVSSNIIPQNIECIMQQEGNIGD